MFYTVGSMGVRVVTDGIVYTDEGVCGYFIVTCASVGNVVDEQDKDYGNYINDDTNDGKNDAARATNRHHVISTGNSAIPENAPQFLKDLIESNAAKMYKM
jgi:hypothetical protein